MKTNLPFTPNVVSKFINHGKLYLLLVLLGFSNNLLAGTSPASKKRHSDNHATNGKLVKTVQSPVGISPAPVYFTAPTLSYSSPQTFTAGTAITPLSPTSSGVSPLGYSTSPVASGTGFNGPVGIAVDAAGNIYVADKINNAIEKIPAAGGAWAAIGNGFSLPTGVAVDAAGNVYVADNGNNAVKKIAAGTNTTTSIATGLNGPFGVAVDAAGNVYVSDAGNNNIDKIPASNGVLEVIATGLNSPAGIAVDAFGNIYFANEGASTINELLVNGGPLLVIGTSFSNPTGVTIDASGNVYVADYVNNAVKMIPAVTGTTIAIGGTGFSNPSGVAVDASGNVYVVDHGNNAVKKISPDGGFFISPALPAGLSFDSTTGTISGTPTAASAATIYSVVAYNSSGSKLDKLNIKVNLPAAPTISYTTPQTYTAGVAITALAPAITGYNNNLDYTHGATNTIATGFNGPTGVAVDASGNLYVADAGNNEVKKIALGIGSPTAIGSGFSNPQGVAVDAAGNVYVADAGNNAVKKLVGGTGAPVTIGSGFSSPMGVSVDAAGNVYVADYGNNAIKKIPVNTGKPIIIYNVQNPVGVWVDASGNVYASFGNDVIQVPAVGGQNYSEGGGGALSQPAGTVTDNAGDIFILYEGSNTIEANIEQTPAGAGLLSPHGLALDSKGILYIADTKNNVIKSIKPVGGTFINQALPAGLSFDRGIGEIYGTPTVASPATTYTVTTYNYGGSATATINIKVNVPTAPVITYSSPQTYTAGTAITPLSPNKSNVAAAGYSSMPTVVSSAFSQPTGVAADAFGNIYVTDQVAKTVSEINASNGAVSTIGTGFTTPYGIALDAASNVYVSDIGDKTVKKIAAGNGGTATIASGFSNPQGIAVDAAGNVYVADAGLNAVEKILAVDGRVVEAAGGFNAPSGVAVDAAGNLYVSDLNNRGVVEVYASDTGNPYVTYGLPAGPTGVAVDATGNVFFSLQGANAVEMVPAGGNTPVLIGSGFGNPYGVAVDGYGNVIVADAGVGQVKKIAPVGGVYISAALPAGLTLNNNTGVISGTPVAASTSTTYTVTAYNYGTKGQCGLSISVGLPPVPVISYSGPQVYSAGTAITALKPTSSGVGALGTVNTPVSVGAGFSGPTGVAVDNAGNVYIADASNNAVKVLSNGTGSPTTLGSGFNYPAGVGVDATGNVYVADRGDNDVKKIPVGNGTVVTLGANFSAPNAVAVDAAGNVYVADGGNNAIEKIPAGSTSTTSWETIALGLSDPDGVAVDAYGNIYVSDFGSSTLKEIPAAGGPPVTVASGFGTIGALSIDASGNIFVSDDNIIKMIPAGGGTTIQLTTGVDAAASKTGILYVADSYNDAIEKIIPAGGYFISPALPSGLSFNSATGVISGTPTVASAATTYTITAYNYGGPKQATVSIQVNLPPAPTISYTTPQTYITGTAISPLNPTSTGVTPPSYSSSPISVGSGFVTPVGIALDAAGYIYVADYGSGDVKKMPIGGGTPVIIGSGFSDPTGVAVDAAGDVYVVDQGNNAIKLMLYNGASYAAPVTVLSGLNGPFGVAVNASGDVYVSDPNDNDITVVPSGSTTPYVIGSGFSVPTGIALDAAGNLYVADQGNHQLKMIPATGGAPIVMAGGFVYIYGVAVDPSGNIYVTDGSTNLVEKIPVGGGPAMAIGSGFYFPTGVAVGPAGNVFVADYTNSQVKEVKTTGGYFISPALPAGLNFDENTGIISGTPINGTAQTTYTINAHNQGGGQATTIQIQVNSTFPPTLSYQGPQTYNVGTAITPLAPTSSAVAAAGYNPVPVTVGSGFHDPNGVAVDLSGNVYVADYGDNAIKKFPAGGGATTTVATINSPAGVAVDASGNIYVADYSDNLIKEIPSSGGSILNLGSGLMHPYGVAVDAAGNVYVADQGNSEVKEISANHVVTSVIGSGFSFPTGVAVDAAGNVYVADGGNQAVKEILVNGGNVITLGAGYLNPTGIAVDAAGDVFVADVSYNEISEMPAGSSTHIALGSGFINPQGVAVAYNGLVYACDNHHNAVKKITPLGGYYINALPAGLSLNNATGVISGTPTATSPAANYTVTAFNYGGGTSASVNIAVTAVANAKLTSLVINAGTLTPAFTSSTNNYTVSVPYPQSSVKLTPTVAAAGSTVTINGTAVASGATSGFLILKAGPNTIKVVVTAQDGTTTDTYTLVVTRAAPSTDASLANIVLNKGSLTPAFASGTTSYSDMVTNGTASITITPTTTDATATVTVNGTAVASGKASGAIALTVGTNTITVIATAQDGVTKQTYTISVIRPSTNAKLASLTINAGALTPAFNTNTTGYTVNELYAQSSIKLTPTVAAAGATVIINGTAVASGATSGFIILKVGVNTVPIIVTAQDGTTTDTYTLTVTRAVASTNDNLSALALSKGTLTPAFASTSINYTAMETNGTASVTITPTTQVTTSTVMVNGVSVISGHASGAIALSVGTNAIPVIVTAQDGATKKTYTVNVIRPSTNAKLSALIISSGTLSPAFNTNTTPYSDAVTNATASVTIKPTVAVTGATVTVNGAAVASGAASGAIALTVGSNTITTVVTAQDGVTTNTYTITVTRAAGGENTPDAAVNVGVQNFEPLPLLADDGISVHQGVSPNGDGINDFLQIDNISQYPDNNLKIMNRNGQLIYEAKGYDNATKTFDGHSNKNGQMQLPGTYFYSLDYTIDGVTKHKTGFLVLKY